VKAFIGELFVEKKGDDNRYEYLSERGSYNRGHLKDD
jgi:hypothetical protein